MSFAGQQLIADRIPTERIATTIEDTDSAGTVSEAVAVSVEAPVIAGRIYRVRFAGGLQSSVGGDEITQRIREDGLVGNQIGGQRVFIENGGDAAGTFGYSGNLETQYEALLTENKTFVVTIERRAGSGNVRLEASASRPAFLYVDYIEG